MSDPIHLRPVCNGAGRDQPAVPLLIRKGDFHNERSSNTEPQEGRCLLPVTVRRIQGAHAEVHEAFGHRSPGLTQQTEAVTVEKWQPQSPYAESTFQPQSQRQHVTATHNTENWRQQSRAQCGRGHFRNLTDEPRQSVGTL